MRGRTPSCSPRARAGRPGGPRLAAGEAEAFRRLLSGGDRRSLARSEEVRAQVRAAPERVAVLATLASDGDPLVAMRAVDLLEKLARERAGWVQPYRKLFLGPLADSAGWEVRLQVVRILPLLRWAARERERAVAVLTRDVAHPQKFVRAWALDGLAHFASDDPALHALVLQHAAAFERSGSKALAARARQIRARLGETGAPAARAARQDTSAPH